MSPGPKPAEISIPRSPQKFGKFIFFVKNNFFQNYPKSRNNQCPRARRSQKFIPGYPYKNLGKLYIFRKNNFSQKISYHEIIYVVVPERHRLFQASIQAPVKKYAWGDRKAKG